MILFSRELKANLRSLLIWGLALGLLNVLMMAIFPTMASDGTQLSEVVATYPEAMLKIFGLDQMDLGTPLGFYGAEAFFMITLFGGLFAAILGSGILAKEEDEKTIEFLLARPVTRGAIIVSKVLAWVVHLVLFNAIIGAFTWASFCLFPVGDFSAGTLFALLLAPLFIHLVFAALGFFLALFFPRRRASLSIGIGMVLGLYFLNAIALLSENSKLLGWLSPFHYMDAKEIVAKGGVGLFEVLALLGAAALLVILTFVLYRRRDFTA